MIIFIYWINKSAGKQNETNEKVITTVIVNIILPSPTLQLSLKLYIRCLNYFFYILIQKMVQW